MKIKNRSMVVLQVKALEKILTKTEMDELMIKYEEGKRGSGMPIYSATPEDLVFMETKPTLEQWTSFWGMERPEGALKRLGRMFIEKQNNIK